MRRLVGMRRRVIRRLRDGRSVGRDVTRMQTAPEGLKWMTDIVLLAKSNRNSLSTVLSPLTGIASASILYLLDLDPDSDHHPRYFLPHLPMGRRVVPRLRGRGMRRRTCDSGSRSGRKEWQSVV